VEIYPCLRIMGILVKVVDTFCVEGTGTTNQAMDFIAFGEEKFS
jgi:hypothetical protein